MAWSISSVCLGHLPGCMPPSTLYPPQSLWGTRQQAEWKREKALRLCQHCSERAEISERYQHCSGHQEHGTVTAARKKLTLSQPDPVQWENKIAFFLHGKQMPDFKKAQSARSLETFHPQIPDCKIISSWTYSLAGAFDWCSKGLTSFLNTKLNSFFLSPVISQYMTQYLVQNMLEELFNRLQEMTIIPQYGLWKKSPDKCHKETGLDGTYLTLFSSVVSVPSPRAQMSQHCDK